MTELEEDYALLLEAYERLEKHRDEPGIPMTDVMSDLGISGSDLDEIEDVENADTVDAMLETKRMLNNPTLKTL